MNSESLKTATYKDFDIRYYVVGDVAYLCPEDLRVVMQSESKEIDMGEEIAWDKVEAGRRIFPYFEFFEWFSVEFDKFDYTDDVVLIDPMPW